LADVDELVERLQVIDETVVTKESQLEAQSRPDTMARRKSFATLVSWRELTTL
jgi:hypothetical protein